MALMESPAIIFAILMANLYRSQEARQEHAGIVGCSYESFTEGAQILLLGAMVIGIITGGSGKTIMDPFTGMIFKGMLAFFCWIWGCKRRRDSQTCVNVPKRLAFYGVLAPITHASIALLLSGAGACRLPMPRLAVLAGRVIHSGPSSVEARPARIKPRVHLGSFSLTSHFRSI